MLMLMIGIVKLLVVVMDIVKFTTISKYSFGVDISKGGGNCGVDGGESNITIGSKYCGVELMVVMGLVELMAMAMVLVVVLRFMNSIRR